MGHSRDAYGVVVPFVCYVAVSVAPVEGHLLLLLLVQPDELLGGPRHEVMQVLQIVLSLSRTILVGRCKGEQSGGVQFGAIYANT